MLRQVRCALSAAFLFGVDPLVDPHLPNRLHAFRGSIMAVASTLTKTQPPQRLVFNICGIAALGLSAAYAINHSLSTETVAGCDVRYPSQTELSLNDPSGKPLSPIELQARLGSNQWGLLKNARVFHVENAPAAAVLRVKMAQGSAGGSDSPQGGVGFRWLPRGMNDATAACLSYSVWLPKDFDFGAAGVLPGLFGGDRFDPSDVSSSRGGFGTRIGWRSGGEGLVAAQISNQGTSWQTVGLANGAFAIPRGRWARLEQEVVLNSNSLDNGTLRLWLDGDLKAEQKDIFWSFDKELKIAGVLADVYYGGIDPAAKAPKSTALLISPLNVRWK